MVTKANDRPWYLAPGVHCGGTSASTTATWTQWNETLTTTSTTGAIWTHWVGAGGSSTTSITAATSILMGGGGGAVAFPANEYQPTPEARERRARIEGERQTAREKARLLLDQHLSPEQRQQLAAGGYFELQTISKDGERRRYQISRGRAGNVTRVDDQGRHLKRYCIHPGIACPDEDTMLTQKLWLETNEELFLRTANAS